MPKILIHFTEAQVEAMNAVVSEGFYTSRSELIREALREKLQTSHKGTLTDEKHEPVAAASSSKAPRVNSYGTRDGYILGPIV